MAKGEVRFRLVLDSKDFTNGIKAAKNEANAMAQDLSSRLGKAGSVLSAMGPAGLAAAAGVGALGAAVGGVLKVTVDAVSAAAKYADTLAALEDKTGLSGKALQELEVAAKLGNTSLEAIASSVNKMQVNLVNGSENFRKLGLSIKDLKAMSPEQQFAKVSQAILALGTAAERTAASKAIMGKSATELMGAMKAAASGATELGGALSDDALKAAADLQDQTDLLDTAWERVKLQFGAAIAQSPELKNVLNDITAALVKMAETIAKLTPQIVNFLSVVARQAQFAGDIFKAYGQFVTGNAIGAFQTMQSGQAAFDMPFFNDVTSGGSTTAKKPKPGTFVGGKTPKAPKKNFLPQLNLSNQAIADLFGGTPGIFQPAKLDKLPGGFLSTDQSRDLLGGTPAIMQATTKATIDWRNALFDVANAFSTMQGKAAQGLGAIAGGIATIGQMQKSLATDVSAGGLKGAGGLGGLLGKVGAGLGIAGAAISIGSTIFGGIKSLFGGKSKEEKAAEEAAKQQKIKDTLGQMEGLLQKISKIKMDSLTNGVSGLASMFSHLAKSEDVSKERLERLGLVGSAMFLQLKKEGLSTLDAIEAMGPALDQALAAAKEHGIELGGTFGALAAFRGKVQANEGLVAAAEGHGAAMEALKVTGSMTPETMKAMREELGSLYGELTEKGFSANEATALMARSLLQLRDAAREGKIELTEQEKAMIAVAESSGAFEGIKDPMEELVEVQKMMLELWAAIAHMQGVTLPDSLRKYLDEINNTKNAIGSMPTPGGPGMQNKYGGEDVDFPEGSGEPGHAAGGLHTILGSGPMSGGGTPLVGHPGEEVYIGKPRGGFAMPPIVLRVDGKTWARHNNQNIRRNRYGTSSEARRFS